MSRASMRPFFVTLGPALRRATEARLLILWMLGLALPTLLFAAPIYALIAPHLNHSPAAASLASHIDERVLNDLPGVVFHNPEVIVSASVASALLAALIAAWLNGLAVGAFRARHNAGFATLISAANSYYWRMLRMGLLSLVPLAVVLAISQALGSALGAADDRAVVESSTSLAHFGVLMLELLLYALAQCSVDIARACMAIDPRRRSVLRSWLDAVVLLVRYPLLFVFVFTLPSLLGSLIALVLFVLRVNIDQASAAGVIAALVLAEAIALTITLMRLSRLFALAELVIQIRQR